MEFEYNKPEDSVVEEVVAVETAPVVAEPIVEETPIEVAPVVEQPKKKSSKGDLVAIRSPKKVAMDGVPTLNVGINYLTKEDADKWLAAKHYLVLVEGSAK